MSKGDTTRFVMTTLPYSKWGGENVIFITCSGQLLVLAGLWKMKTLKMYAGAFKAVNLFKWVTSCLFKGIFLYKLALRCVKSDFDSTQIVALPHFAFTTQAQII